MPRQITRAAYADMFGPTVGDKVRLADTELFIEVEADRTIYGEEVKFGGGKVIRDGMGQSQTTRAAGRGRHGDHQRADPRPLRASSRPTSASATAASPASARPATQTSSPASTSSSGPGTEAIAGEGKIVTAGGLDCHIHFICPQQIEEALYSAASPRMLGGGTGPATGTNATTCTPGPWHIGRMLQAAEAWPMNLGFAGKGNASHARRPDRADPGRRLRAQAARGLGHDAGRDRLLPRRRRRDGRPGR